MVYGPHVACTQRLFKQSQFKRDITAQPQEQISGYLYAILVLKWTTYGYNNEPITERSTLAKCINLYEIIYLHYAHTLSLSSQISCVSFSFKNSYSSTWAKPSVGAGSSSEHLLPSHSCLHPSFREMKVIKGSDKENILIFKTSFYRYWSIIQLWNWRNVWDINVIKESGDGSY